jgi:glucan phosphoethanolaminetransferase (alkaline phosphatase superfamily)
VAMGKPAPGRGRFFRQAFDVVPRWNLRFYILLIALGAAPVAFGVRAIARGAAASDAIWSRVGLICGGLLLIAAPFVIVFGIVYVALRLRSKSRGRHTSGNW